MSSKGMKTHKLIVTYAKVTMPNDKEQPVSVTVTAPNNQENRSLIAMMAPDVRLKFDEKAVIEGRLVKTHLPGGHERALNMVIHCANCAATRKVLAYAALDEAQLEAPQLDLWESEQERIKAEADPQQPLALVSGAAGETE